MLLKSQIVNIPKLLVFNKYWNTSRQKCVVGFIGIYFTEWTMNRYFKYENISMHNLLK